MIVTVQRAVRLIQIPRLGREWLAVRRTRRRGILSGKAEMHVENVDTELPGGYVAYDYNSLASYI